eukprot:16431290-Heterocapsa_arctica.AAC.1
MRCSRGRAPPAPRPPSLPAARPPSVGGGPRPIGARPRSTSNIDIEHRHRNRTSKLQGVRGHRGEHLSPAPSDAQRNADH